MKKTEKTEKTEKTDKDGKDELRMEYSLALRTCL